MNSNRQATEGVQAVLGDEAGATTLEWALLLVVMGIPAYWMAKIALNTLLAYYAMATTLNGLPFP